MAVYETSIDYCSGDEFVTVYTNDKTYVQKLKAMYKTNRDNILDWVEYKVEGEPDTIKARVPKKWFKFISPPRKVNLSEEEKAKRAERMAKAREAKKKENV